MTTRNPSPRIQGCKCPHGYSRYTHGCRCETCRAAKADYIRSKRAEARSNAGGQPVSEAGRNYVPEITHGIYGYQERMCRCEVCTHAKAEAMRRQYRAAVKVLSEGVS